MAKKSISVRFSNATLTVEEGKYIITEIKKDDSTDYDLSISITSEDVVEPISEE